MVELAAVIERLDEYFSRTHWPDGLNRDKLIRRTRLMSATGHENIVVAEIERHRAILGDQYLAGCPMDAYETYLMRFEVDPGTGSVKHLPETHVRIDIDVDGLVKHDLLPDFFSLSVSQIDERRFLIKEGVSKESAEITSVDEAISFAVALEYMHSDYFMDQLDRLSDDCAQLDDECRIELHKYYSEALHIALEIRGAAAWKDREFLDPD